MAKKKNDEPVYMPASLVIPKERFIELLRSQIEKGKELLRVEVARSSQRDPYMGYMHTPNDRVNYEESAQNEFFARFNRWHDYNKEIYRSSFSQPNSIYLHDYESQIWSHIVIEDIIKDYKEDIGRLINQMQTDIERSELMKCDAPEDTVNKSSQQNTEKPYKVFISHCSKDKEFVKHLVDLLEVIGIDGKDKLFCSSVPLYGIDLSGKIFESLLAQFKDYRLFVIFVHSENYYNSPVSLNEMGAAWVLQTDYCSFLTKGFDFKDMKGVVHDDEIAIKVDGDNDEITLRLNQLKDKLVSLFHQPIIDNDRWEWKRNLFLERVNK